MTSTPVSWVNFVAVVAEREAARATSVARSFGECILKWVRGWWVRRYGSLEVVVVGLQ
jgi:hypothetical protein